MRYIGNKAQLLGEIENVIKSNCKQVGTFLDIFSGSGTVARFFKKDYEVYSNDILYFSYVLQMATIENDSVPEFTILNDYLKMNVFDYMDNIDCYASSKFNDDQLFMRNTYSDFCGRNYFTTQNAIIIDLWRLELEQWKSKELVSNNEYYYLLACIIETVPFFSNIAGTYGAYLKTWDPRALKKMKLVRLEVPSNGKDNKSYNMDCLDLLEITSGDILYIDPPYNERQYLPNYHILETIARYDYPAVKGVTGIRPYSKEKSAFCNKLKALPFLESMISKANFRYIILSYNTDGIMNEEDIKSLLESKSVDGQCHITKIPYKRFKSRTLKNESSLYELLFLIEKSRN